MGKVGGGGEPVVAAADDDRVEGALAGGWNPARGRGAVG